MALIAMKTAGLALAMNYGVHVGSSIAYSEFCIPHTVWDIGQSIVSTASPVCSFLLNTMQVTQSNYAVVLTTTLVGIASGILKPI
jgi:hypothetical protein